MNHTFSDAVKSVSSAPNVSYHLDFNFLSEIAAISNLATDFSGDMAH